MVKDATQAIAVASTITSRALGHDAQHCLMDWLLKSWWNKLKSYLPAAAYGNEDALMFTKVLSQGPADLVRITRQKT